MYQKKMGFKLYVKAYAPNGRRLKKTYMEKNDVSKEDGIQALCQSLRAQRQTSQKNLHGKERCIKRRWDSSFMSKPTRPTADVSKANVITGYFIIAVAKSPERDAHVADSNIFHTSAVCAEK